MIYVSEHDVFIKNPLEEISNISVKNNVYKNLEKGLLSFLVPDDFIDAQKNLKRNYKVGFLYDLLGNIYPSKGKEDKYKIISEKYHLWFTYRQFHNVIEEYEKDRNKYIYKRNILKQCI